MQAQSYQRVEPPIKSHKGTDILDGERGRPLRTEGPRRMLCWSTRLPVVRMAARGRGADLDSMSDGIPPATCSFEQLAATPGFEGCASKA